MPTDILKSDEEIERLRTAIKRMIDASEEGSSSDAIQDMLEIAREALEPEVY